MGTSYPGWVGLEFDLPAKNGFRKEEGVRVPVHDAVQTCRPTTCVCTLPDVYKVDYPRGMSFDCPRCGTRYRLHRPRLVLGSIGLTPWNFLRMQLGLSFLLFPRGRWRRV